MTTNQRTLLAVLIGICLLGVAAGPIVQSVRQAGGSPGIAVVLTLALVGGIIWAIRRSNRKRG